MQHCSGGWPAPPAGHVQGIDDQFGAQVVSDGPAHHPAGPDVQDDGAIQPALPGAVLGDVSDPQPVLPVRGELAVHQIRVRAGRGIADRAALMPAAVDAGQPGLAHQPLHAFAAAPQALAEPQLGMDPRGAVTATGLLMDLADHGGQVRICLLPG